MLIQASHDSQQRPSILKYSIDYSTSQLPASDNLSRASRSNEWLYVDFEPAYT